jgi:hypothetical protein
MRRTLLDVCLSFAFFLSVVFIGQSVVAQVSCGNICERIIYYAKDDPGAGIKYFAFQTGDCLICMTTNGSCVWPGPTQPYCNPDPTQIQMLAAVNRLNLTCPLVPQGRAEGQDPAGIGQFTNVGNVNVCSNTPPNPG